MVTTSIQLPDDLYQRAKQLEAEQAVSLGELAVRGLELLLSRRQSDTPSQETWRLPQVDCGGLKVSLDCLHDISAGETELHVMAGDDSNE